MKFSKKIVKIASSLGIIIDKRILDELNVEKGDWVEVEVNKVK